MRPISAGFYRFCLLLLLIGLPLSGGEIRWQAQNSGLSVSCRGISVTNANTAWISGGEGRFSRTSDGGKTWVAGQVPAADSFDFRDIAVFGDIIYLMAAGTGQSARIYRSEDGGDNWTLQFINPYPAGFFSGIAFRDAQNGMILSDPVHGKFVLYTTSDGGKSWLQVDPASAPAVREGEYAFAASGTCIISDSDGGYRFASGGTASRVFSTTDNGASWKASESGVINGLPSTGIFSIAFRDANNGVIVGGDYANPDSVCNNLQLTTDGGKTWKSLKPAAQLGFLSAAAWITLIDQAHLLVCGSDTSAILDLQGKVVVNLGDGFHAIGVSPDRQSIWATGSEGRVGKLILK